jgi:hypothetical protein
LVGSAVIALGLAFLPIGSGTSSARGIAMSGTVSNSALKSDRLPAFHAVVAPKTQSGKTESGTSSAIPVGCEAAFSKLVRVGNFSSRCLT